MALSHPALRGGLLALSSALLFGLTIPLVQRAGSGVGPFATAALLYGGAALLGWLTAKPASQEAALLRRDLPRLGLMALFGAVIGPVALAWGLQHTSGISAALMLTLEALFTVALARLLYREVMDRRVWAAMLLLLVGGVVLVVDRSLAQAVVSGAQAVASNATALGWLGLLSVLAATAAWGMDNSLSRALAERDPSQVVWAKSALGAAATSGLALLAAESLPNWQSALALLLIGALGYGLSLRLYLAAQRALGAARTGSVFAFAPFMGALLAIALGERDLSWGMALGGGLMLSGVLLHLLERHGHEHAHEAMAHEHAHTHDEVHHAHRHPNMPAQAHSHLHTHTPLRHTHPHTPDAHHLHPH